MLHLTNLAVVEAILMVEQKTPPLNFRECGNRFAKYLPLLCIKNQFFNAFGYSKGPLIKCFIP